MKTASVDDAYKEIEVTKPQVIYVNGKTSTGKSTFAHKLKENLGYQIIELEKILLKIINDYGFDEQTTFYKVINEPGDFEEKRLFITAVDQQINELLNSDQNVVIDGSIANVDTLAQILEPAKDLYFLYFHPGNLDAYVRNLTSRFMDSNESFNNGLPLKFWNLIDKVEFRQFCETGDLSEGIQKSIKEYANISREESLVRLNDLHKKFNQIVVIEIQ